MNLVCHKKVNIIIFTPVNCLPSRRLEQDIAVKFGSMGFKGYVSEVRYVLSASPVITKIYEL